MPPTTTTATTAANQFRRIGKGFCGSVWALEIADPSDPDYHRAIKRGDGGPDRSISNDFKMHRLILDTCTMPALVPRCYQLVDETDTDWWAARAYRFPSDYKPCTSVVSEHIPPFSQRIREQLLDAFCPEQPISCSCPKQTIDCPCPKTLKEFVKTNPADEDCLVRPYLGRRRRHAPPKSDSEERPTRFQRFSLRNYPLHIDQIETLGLDALAYARTMASTLATMHWSAQVEANDVEFVLAPARAGHGGEIFVSQGLGTHTMWILDFDCCRSISTDATGVAQACDAFLQNNPFYPRPASTTAADESLWSAFRERFLEASREIVGEDGEREGLPGMLVTLIEERGAELRKRKDAIIGD